MSNFLEKTIKDRGGRSELREFIENQWRVYNPKEIMKFNSHDKTNFYLSNMFPFSGKFKGNNVFSVDQIFYLQHALKTNDDKIISDILNCSGMMNAFEAKKKWGEYSKDNKLESTIDEIKESISFLYEAWKVKFKYCKEFRDFLIYSKTNCLKLVENAPWDGVFGTCYNPKTMMYEGCNLCGRYMQKFRNEILSH